MSVRPAARDNSVPTERIFMKFRFWNFYENLSRKFKFCRHLIKITVTLHEDLRTFMTTVATTLSWLAMFLRSLLLFLLQWLPWLLTLPLICGYHCYPRYLRYKFLKFIMFFASYGYANVPDVSYAKDLPPVESGMVTVRMRHRTIPCTLTQSEQNCTALYRIVWRLHGIFIPHLRRYYAAICQRFCNFVFITTYFCHVYL